MIEVKENNQLGQIIGNIYGQAKSRWNENASIKYTIIRGKRTFAIPFMAVYDTVSIWDDCQGTRVTTDNQNDWGLHSKHQDVWSRPLTICKKNKVLQFLIHPQVIRFLLAFYQRDFIPVISYPNIWKMNSSVPALLKRINGSIFK